MPVRDLKATSNASEVAQSLMKGHPIHLNPSIVSKDQITRLVQQLINKLSSNNSCNNNKNNPLPNNNPFFNSSSITNPFTGNNNQQTTNPFINPDTNAPKQDTGIPTNNNTPALPTMSSFSSTNKLGPLPTLAPLSSKSNIQFGAGNILSGGDKKALQPVLTEKPKPKGSLGLKSILAGGSKDVDDDLLDDENDSYGEDFLEDSDEDLNKLDDKELNMKKAQMEVMFEKNKKRPGDPGYEYDVQNDFLGAKQPSEWDEELDDDF